MNQILRIIVSALIFMSALHATDMMVDKAKLQELTKYNKVLQNPKLKIITAIEEPTQYILKLEGKSRRGSQLLTGFLNKQTGEFHLGTGYKKDGTPIVFPKDAKIIKEGVAFSYGQGEKEIYLVTDPECPYCKKYEKATMGKLQDYRVHVILFPLSFHKKSPAMIEWIMQGKDDVEKTERLQNVMLGKSKEYKELLSKGKKPFPYSPKVKAYMIQMRKAVSELGTRGTPSLYDEAFNPLSKKDLLKSLKRT